MTNLNRFTGLYKRYRNAPFNCTASQAADYARAKMWLDEHLYTCRNGEYCMPATLADAERLGYTGVVWMNDDCFDIEGFYGLDEPEQTRATKELREKLRSGEWEALVLFLLVNGEIVDNLGSIVVGHGDADRERFELDMASEHLHVARKQTSLAL